LWGFVSGVPCDARVETGACRANGEKYTIAAVPDGWASRRAEPEDWLT
jgi:hypothetical protein